MTKFNSTLNIIILFTDRLLVASISEVIVSFVKSFKTRKD